MNTFERQDTSFLRYHFEVLLQPEIVCPSLIDVGDFFQRGNSLISRYTRNIFKEGELIRDSALDFAEWWL